MSPTDTLRPSSIESPMPMDKSFDKNDPTNTNNNDQPDNTNDDDSTVIIYSNRYYGNVNYNNDDR